MKKQEFISDLLERLEGLPQSEKDKAVEYYNEIYLDKRENGIKEEDIVSAWGTPSDVALRILIDGGYVKTEPFYNVPFTEKVTQKVTQTVTKAKEKSKSLFKNKTFWIIYFSCFFITIPLTIAAVATVFGLGVGFLGTLVGLLAGFFCIVIGLFAITFGGIIGGVAGIIYSIIIMFTSLSSGLALLGTSLAFIGVSVLLTFPAKWLFKLVKLLFRKTFTKGGKKHE